MSSTFTAKQVARIVKNLAVIVEPGSVTELRALNVEQDGARRTYSGFFDSDHLPAMAEAAAALSPLASGVYMTLNRLQPEILERQPNSVDMALSATLAKAADVAQRRWLLVDVDPVRPGDVAATDDEKKAAETHGSSVQLATGEGLARAGGRRLWLGLPPPLPGRPPAGRQRTRQGRP